MTCAATHPCGSTQSASHATARSVAAIPSVRTLILRTKSRPAPTWQSDAALASTHGYQVPHDECASYEALYAGLSQLEADTHMHVHKENNLLFPAVLQAENLRAQ